jgi:hypothetical protein
MAMATTQNMPAAQKGIFSDLSVCQRGQNMRAATITYKGIHTGIAEKKSIILSAMGECHPFMASRRLVSRPIICSICLNITD